MNIRAFLARCGIAILLYLATSAIIFASSSELFDMSPLEFWLLVFLSPVTLILAAGYFFVVLLLSFGIFPGYLQIWEDGQRHFVKSMFFGGLATFVIYMVIAPVLRLMVF